MTKGKLVKHSLKWQPYTRCSSDSEKFQEFFLKLFSPIHSDVLFWGHFYPCFGFLVVSPLGFKARAGSALFELQSTSGATPGDLLKANIIAGRFPTCISRSGSWLRLEQAIINTEDECATIVPATLLSLKRLIHNAEFIGLIVRNCKKIQLFIIVKCYTALHTQSAINTIFKKK